MIGLINSQHSKVNPTDAAKRLARAIMLSQGQFSLLLACCNSSSQQERALSLLAEFSPVTIKEILISPSAETLYTTIANTIGSNQPEALMVRGLESVVGINQLITSTNMMRDEFGKRFNFPLILWVNDEIVRKLIWLAPDLKDWAATTIRFDLPSHELIEMTALSA
ncbi:MAG: hypothetical protein QNJ47_02075 [Nostocaceae cyanobacterium]|nr:hypothetical protein [Nostocaceae cyanobacterium]